MKVIYLCIYRNFIFLLSLNYSVTTPTTQWKRAARVFFTLYYTSLFFETVERTEDTKCMMKLKKEQRYFAVFFSLAILLSASKTPIYDYNTQTTAYIPDKNFSSFLTC